MKAKTRADGDLTGSAKRIGGKLFLGQAWKRRWVKKRAEAGGSGTDAYVGHPSPPGRALCREWARIRDEVPDRGSPIARLHAKLAKEKGAQAASRNRSGTRKVGS